MNLTLFFSLLGCFAMIYLFIAKKSAEETSNVKDYFLSKKGLGIFSLSMTLLATQLGGGSLSGAADEAYMRGWSVIFYPLGISLGLIFLALGFGSQLQKLKLSTISELFEKVYSSKLLRKLTSLLSIATLFFILIGQGVAARKFFCAIGLDSSYVFLIFWLIVISYTVIGGLKAVVNTDVVQMIFTIGTFIAVLIFAQTSVQGPLLNSSQILPAVPVVSSSVPWFTWLLMPLLFMVIEQDMGQRCFAARSAKTVRWAGIIAAVLLMACSLFAVYFGVLAKKLGLEIAGDKGVLITVISNLTSPVLTTFFASAFLMVILSTADSLLCSIASNLALDFAFFKKSKVLIAQTITFVIGISAMVCSYLFSNIVPLFIVAYEFSVSALLVSVIMAIFLKKPSLKAAVVSMLLGTSGFFAFRIWSLEAIPFPKELITLSLSFIGFLIVQAKEKRKDQIQLSVGKNYDF